MVGERRSVVAAELPNGSYAATVLMCAASALGVAAKLWGTKRVRRISRRRAIVSVGSAEVEVIETTTWRPGSGVPKLLMGLCTFIRSRGQGSSAERVCAHLNATTLSYISLVSNTASASNRVAQGLLEQSRGAAFTLNGLWFPGVGEVHDFRLRRLSGDRLAPYFAVVAGSAAGTRRMRIPARATRFESLSSMARSNDDVAVAAARWLGRFRRFARLGWEAKTPHAKRQIELAARIDAADTLVLLPSQARRPLGTHELDVVFRLADEMRGMVFDDYAAYDSERRVVFAPWVSKLAPLA